MTDVRQASVAFTKAEANGNDFLIVKADDLPREEWPALTRAICDRHTGVGADGVEFVSFDGDQIRLTLLNADGGEAEISGNGTRCVTAWLAERHNFREGSLQTRAGVKKALVRGQSGGYWQISLDMGQPRLESDQVPMQLPGGPHPLVRDHAIDVNGAEVRVTCLSMGNPQCLILVDEFPGNWRELGAALESHAVFPERTNVEFVQVLDAHTIRIVIYERGVGPTESSGTGSCASAVAAILNGRVQSPVMVLTPGGEQTVAWEGAEVHLEGPARLVAEGQFFWPVAAGAGSDRA